MPTAMPEHFCAQEGNMDIVSPIPSTVKRWICFNFVGAMGILVQMGILWGLTSALHLRYLTATALAVEAAVLHNFFWHERWTWADRIAKHNSGVFSRLLCFHLTNGALSIAGNLILMTLFVEKAGFHTMHANALSIALCSILNFMLGDRLVFARSDCRSERRTTDMANKSSGIIVLSFSGHGSPTYGRHHADTRPQSCSRKTVQGVGSLCANGRAAHRQELSSQKGFLALDFQDSVGVL